jgi:glycosyltransferase involved in cell wall biosynthesis
LTVKLLVESAPRLSAILIVRDEAHCLERCLRSVYSIADEIIVLDSGSTDNTVAVAKSFCANVEITDWPGYGPQKNRALNRARGEWVLAIDADEHVTPELANSIRKAVESPQPEVNGYFIQFLATWCGKPLRFGDWGRKEHLRLFRRTCARFTDAQVHERVECQPPYGTLDGLMIHDTIASEAEAVEKNRRYAELGAQILRARGRGGMLPAILHSIWALLRGYLLRGGFLDGVTGWKVTWASTRYTWLRYRLATAHNGISPVAVRTFKSGKLSDTGALTALRTLFVNAATAVRGKIATQLQRLRATWLSESMPGAIKQLSFLIGIIALNWWLNAHDILEDVLEELDLTDTLQLTASTAIEFLNMSAL